MASAIKMLGVVKRFGTFAANDQVSFEVAEGEIHALLGENGAGKSTLMNILYGLYQPDEGEIFLRGERVRINNPSDAIRLGIGMVHQHFMLIPALTVAENIILGMDRGFALNLEQACTEIAELSRDYGLDVEPRVKVWQLTVGQQQRVEIVKALFRKAKVLILDEPTAVLTPQEVEDLFVVLRRLTQEGMTVIFISHKLHEVFSICNRVTVLRQGKTVATLETKDTDKVQLAKLMVGRDLDMNLCKVNGCTTEPVLTIKNLECLNDKGLPALKKVNLHVCGGEILGIAGVDGNGQTELVEAITGLRPVASGEVRLLSEDVTHYSPRRRLMLGLGHIPADRHKHGVIMDMTVTENMILQTYFQEPYCKKGGIMWKKAKQTAEQLTKEYDVRTTSCELTVGRLSGGNQQKVVLAREVSRNPKFLIAAHPVRGLDIGATEYVHHKLLEQREKGTGVLLVSTELEEIIALSDRVAVMFEGEIVGVLEGEDINVTQIGLLMAGAQKSEAAS
ncbi:ABC transporter ATP-binding protein [Paradesulfitobacterium ferrireducens]|uniref:ABC transporter ATP-binding protein n=1 Tax=Paradesulfitobacterium ferrireducens TaxID=2816476 RepID=UPI001A8C19D8|nr:ABC transporter ATP-binding protein [Paradesulfitobacterium ferrireducens]